MRKFNLYAACLALLLGVGLSAYAQQPQTDRVSVPFSDPGKPGLVRVSVHRGSVTITGTSSREVTVEARVLNQPVKKRKENKKASGMQLIQSAASGLRVTEEDNVLRIGVESMRQKVDVIIQVPANTSLKVSTHNDGDITVEGVTGTLELGSHNGAIRLNNVGGAIVAQTHNGEVKVGLNRVTPDTPMSFVTWNGDVDVTLPASTKANLKLNSERGDIYSDFEFQIVRDPGSAKGKRDEEGKYRISFDKSINAAINGGGPEFRFKNYNGDIFVRKGK